jgi:hypothetical protein
MPSFNAFRSGSVQCGMVDAEMPWEPPAAGSEVEHLLGALNRLRTTFRWKSDGLNSEQLQQRVGASVLSIGALLKHLALCEDYMFTVKMRGAELGEPWLPTSSEATSSEATSSGAADSDSYGPDWAFTSAVHNTPQQLYALWDGAVERSHLRLADALEMGGLDQLVHISWPDGTHASLRRLVCDLIEEYGRHTGHADLLREAIDGLVGEDPPSGWIPTSP